MYHFLEPELLSSDRMKQRETLGRSLLRNRYSMATLRLQMGAHAISMYVCILLISYALCLEVSISIHVHLYPQTQLQYTALVLLSLSLSVCLSVCLVMYRNITFALLTDNSLCFFFLPIDVRIQNLDEITIIDSVFKDNLVTGSAQLNENGGAMNIATTNSISIVGTRFLRNTSNGRGGSIYASLFETFNIEGCSFSKCQSLSNGGGALSFVGAPSPFRNYNGIVSIEDTRFYKNEALSNNTGLGPGLGGAILVEGKATQPYRVSLSVFGSRFIRNAAARNGGAIYSTRADFAEAPLDENIFFRNTLNVTVGVPTGEF